MSVCFNIDDNISYIIWHRKLELFSELITSESVLIFQFLETLPNLQVLDIGSLQPAYLSQFISSIRHTSLLELVLDISFGHVEGLPTAGLVGLKKLSIKWHAHDDPKDPGSSLTHLYKLIQPTLTTLVVLRISDMRPTHYEHSGVFDLQLLKPAADTLRIFEYATQDTDESRLDTIPEILPHLTKLTTKWGKDFANHSILWKEKACIQFSISHSNGTNEIFAA